MINLPEIVHAEFLARRTLEVRPIVAQGLSAAEIYHCKGVAADATQVHHSNSNGFCLRRWPAQYGFGQLMEIYQAVEMSHSEGVELLPRNLLGQSGNVFVADDDGRYWELTQWLPGAANYIEEPSDLKLKSAMIGLARVHQSWKRTQGKSPVSPAIERRTRILAQAIQDAKDWGCYLVDSRLTLTEQQLVRETQAQVAGLGGPLQAALFRASETPCETQFVLRDVHSEHLLFQEDQLQGIIDLGACARDEPATDLARLIGSLEPHRLATQNLAVEIYEREMGCPVPRERVAVLDVVSTLLSAVQWLRWLVVEGREFNRPRVDLLQRWRGFLDRLAQGSFLPWA